MRQEAAGEIRLDIEAAFSQGLPNTPMSHSHIRVISGNFVTARPTGVLDGVDYKHTGQVRKIDVDALKFAIEKGSSVVLLSPLGFSPRATPSTWRWKTWPPAWPWRCAPRNSSSCPARTAC